MLRREEVERVKEQYPKGTPIRLYSMEGEQTVPPGSRGVVDHVDDIGQIHMKWENGSSLALNVEEDRFDIITQQDELCEKKEQEFIDKINEILDKTDFLLLNTSCNTENTSYAAEKLLAMHQAFEEVYGDFQIEAVTRINNLAQRYDNGSEFPEVLIANYDMEERRKSLPMQMNLFEMFDEQKTSVWHGSSRKEDEDGSVSGDNRSAE